MASAKSEPSSDAEAPDQSHEELRYHHILIRLPNSSTLNGDDVIQQLKEDVEQAMAEDGAAHAQVTPGLSSRQPRRGDLLPARHHARVRGRGGGVTLSEIEATLKNKSGVSALPEQGG